MMNDAPAHILAAEERCLWYREIMAQGHGWAGVPCEITEHWLMLLRRSEVSAEDLAGLLRRCDEYQHAEFDPGFFGMCDTVRRLYRAFYLTDLTEALGRTHA